MSRDVIYWAKENWFLIFEMKMVFFCNLYFLCQKLHVFNMDIFTWKLCLACSCIITVGPSLPYDNCVRVVFWAKIAISHNLKTPIFLKTTGIFSVQMLYKLNNVLLNVINQKSSTSTYPLSNYNQKHESAMTCCLLDKKMHKQKIP